MKLKNKILLNAYTRHCYTFHLLSVFDLHRPLVLVLSCAQLGVFARAVSQFKRRFVKSRLKHKE